MIIKILLSIILVLLFRIYLIQIRYGKRLMTLEHIVGSSETKRLMINRNKK